MVLCWLAVPPCPGGTRKWHRRENQEQNFHKFIDISFVKGGMDGKQRKKLLTLVEVCCVALLAPPIVCLFLVPAEVVRFVNLQPRRSPCYRRGPPRRTPTYGVTDEGS